MTWTPHLTHSWRDLSVIFGQDFETNFFSERDLNHARRAMSVIFSLIIKSFTVMTWTPDSTHDWRDMSVIFGQDFETNSFFDRVSIHARRDMSVEKPPAFRATHDDDLDTLLDSRLAGSERHIRPRFRNEFLF